MSDFWFYFLATVVKIAATVGALMGAVSVMTWIERRLSGVIQYRVGPNRVGPFGLFQPIADGVKFIMKEDIMPADAFKPFYVLAPALSLIPALCAFSVIPFGPTIELFGKPISHDQHLLQARKVRDPRFNRMLPSKLQTAQLLRSQ